MRTQYQEGRRIKILYTSIVLSGALIDTHFVTRKFKDHLTKESKHCFTRIYHLLLKQLNLKMIPYQEKEQHFLWDKDVYIISIDFSLRLIHFSEQNKNLHLHIKMLIKRQKNSRVKALLCSKLFQRQSDKAQYMY